MHKPTATRMSISLSFNANIRMVKQMTAATNRMKEMHSTACVPLNSPSESSRVEAVERFIYM